LIAHLSFSALAGVLKSDGASIRQYNSSSDFSQSHVVEGEGANIFEISSNNLIVIQTNQIALVISDGKE